MADQMRLDPRPLTRVADRLLPGKEPALYSGAPGCGAEDGLRATAVTSAADRIRAGAVIRAWGS